MSPSRRDQDQQIPSAQDDSGAASLPADDLSRRLLVTSTATGTHLALVGDTYTVLVTGADTSGRYCLIDMRVPPGGGPGLHRHDFEEMFTLLEGQIDFTFRGAVTTVSAGQTVNIPANAPHFFRNSSGKPARMLCMCTPAGQDEFFAAVGDPVATATSAAPELAEDELGRRLAHMAELAPRYRTELLSPED